MLLRDNFVGVNGTALAAHAPDEGGPWVDDVVGWVIESNKLTALAGSPKSHAPAPCRNGQFSMTVDLNACPGQLFLSLQDDAGNIQVGVNLRFADHPQGFDQDVPGDPNHYETHPGYLSAGPHSILVQYTVSRYSLFVDNQLVATAPRLNPRNANLTRFVINTDQAAVPYPIMSALQVAAL